jgi:RNA polymerase sigma factor (sigma-70 family)
MGEARAGDAADDLRLARDAAAGDADARRTLALRLLRRVRNIARYVVGGETDADDAAQSAMIEILGSLGEYRGAGPLEHWAARIAARTAIAFARRRRSDGRRAEAAPGLAESVEAAGASTADALLVRRRLARCLDRLPEERRETVVLRVVLGFTLDEIARQTGVPANTAKDRLRVGRRELRQAILEDPVLRDIVRKGTP